ARGELEPTLAEAKALDPNTVQFRMKKIFPGFIALHGRRGILPTKVFGKMSPQEFNDAPQHMNPQVTSGPFKFVEQKVGDHSTLERNDAYYGEKALLDRYILKTIMDNAGIMNALKTGEMDC